ncbi:MAG: ClpP family protease [Planctomycetia bacterium]
MADKPTDDDDAASKKKDGSPQHTLLKARSILLFGPIEPKLTREVITQLVLMDQMSKTKPIRLLINSPGGLADDGFAIFDMARFISAPVYTICTGLAASAATIVMVASPKDHRFILPHSRVMLHQPSVGVRGTASDIAIGAKEILRVRKKANELFALETGQPLEKIEKDMHRDFWMAPEEALAYGLVGKIIRSEKDLPAA